MRSYTNSYLERIDCTWSDDSVRLFNTPSQSARQTFFYVQEVGHFHTFPPYFTERANLNSFIIIYTISGKGLLEYLGKRYDLIPGSCMWVNCMNHHYYECPPGQEWEFLWLHFNGTTALGYYEEFEKNGFHILSLNGSSHIEYNLRYILTLTQQTDLHSEILLSQLITDTLTSMLLANSNEELRRDFMPFYLKSIIKKMDEHFQEPLNLDFLSKEYGVSKYHLAREFKRYIGLPPNEYLILTRLNHAKELLKYSTMTVNEITFSCGFHNVSHFINLFKKHEGETPLQFKKEWHSN